MTSKHDPEKVTLAFCRRWLEKRLEGRHAVKCPCCRKPAHKSRRHITKKMVVALVKMYLHQTSETKGLRDGNGDYAKLRHWGLVEQVAHGRWRLTSLGREWLRGRAEVRRTAITYNKRLVRFDEGPVTVFDCFGTRPGFVAMVARVRGGANE